MLALSSYMKYSFYVGVRAIMSEPQKDRTHLGRVEGRLQGHTDRAPEVDAAYDAEHGPLFPGEERCARLTVRSHGVWPQPRPTVSFILCKTQHTYAYSSVIWPGATSGIQRLTLFIAQCLFHETGSISTGRMIRELERIWKEAIVDYSRCYLSICLERPRRTTKIFTIACIPGETLIRIKIIVVYQPFQWRNGNYMYHLLQD
jgi:hypothetical protein